MAEPDIQKSDIAQQVRAAAERLGVDPDFASRVANQESRFNPAAVSRAGARGVMQVMPKTAKDLEPLYGPDNIAQGVGYLRQLGDVFDAVPEGQRQHFVAAAYNAGPSRVLKIMQDVKAAGGDPYNIASLADHLPAETLDYVVRIAGAGKPQEAGARALQPPAQAFPSAAPAPESEGFGQALYRALASEGERQLAAGREFGNVASRGMPQSLGDVADLGLSAASALSPAIFPTGVAGAVTGETAARTGILPVDPETGARLGSLFAGGLALVPGLIRGGARLLSPSLRAVEKGVAARGAAEAKQAGALAQQEAQLAERAAAGGAVPGAAAGIEQRLGADAAAGARQLRELEGRAPTGLVGPSGQPVAARALSEADYTKALGELRTTNQRAAEAAQTFDRAVTRRLRNVPTARIAEQLREDRELVAGLLAHATPAEAAIIQRAVDAGRPLSRLPYTADELAAIGNDVIQGRGVLSPLTHWGIGGAGLGYFIGAMSAGPAAGTAAAVLAARVGLKALDAALGSKPGAATLRQLGRLQPGSPDVVRILAATAGEAATPQRLQPRSR